jgi:hypothetical protein
VGQLHSPASLDPRKKPMCPFNTKFGEPQSRSGLLEKKISYAFQKYLEIIVIYASVTFLLCPRNCEKRLLVSSCLSVPKSVFLSVRMEQLGFHRTDFHEI